MYQPDKCPDKNETGSAYLAEGNDSSDDNSEEINFVFITENDKSEISVAEASTSAVIDTACAKTVAGEKWLKSYTSNLTEKARK